MIKITPISLKINTLHNMSLLIPCTYIKKILVQSYMKIFALQLMFNYFLTHYSWKSGAKQFPMLVTKKEKMKTWKGNNSNGANFSQNTIAGLNEYQKELHQIRSCILKRQCIRSRVKWIEEGQQLTKYVVSLESRNCISKQIPRVQKDDGSIY